MPSPDTRRGSFDSEEAIALFDSHLGEVVSAIGAHPAVHLLEVMNEPRGMSAPERMRTVLHGFVDTIRASSQAPITLGSEGSTRRPDVAGLDFHEGPRPPRGHAHHHPPLAGELGDVGSEV